MKNNLPIEITDFSYSSDSDCLNGGFKITNVSSDYINDLKLIIEDQEHALLEQLVTRERGSLSFPLDVACIELGNLAPNESAYFKYKLNPNITPINEFMKQAVLTFSHTTLPLIQDKKIAECLEASTIK